MEGATGPPALRSGPLPGCSDSPALWVSFPVLAVTLLPLPSPWTTLSHLVASVPRSVILTLSHPARALVTDLQDQIQGFLFPQPAPHPYPAPTTVSSSILPQNLGWPGLPLPLRAHTSRPASHTSLPWHQTRRRVGWEDALVSLDSQLSISLTERHVSREVWLALVGLLSVMAACAGRLL